MVRWMQFCLHNSENYKDKTANAILLGATGWTVVELKGWFLVKLKIRGTLAELRERIYS